jgi:dTDP-4-dehydrorhamnose reductase
MKKKLILIGRKSFLGHYIKKNLSKKLNILHINLSQFNNLNTSILKNFDYICNCSINPKYQKQKYNVNNDIDIKIIKKIKNLSVKFIFLSSRKVYQHDVNLKETSKCKPLNNYAKNKLISENKIKSILKKKYLILRISNIIGKPIMNPRKVTNNFIDNYIKFKKSKKKIFFNNYFKDFLSINQFTEIFYSVIQKKMTGTFNVSLGKKVYISEILNWLNKTNYKSFKPKNNFLDNDSFYLNNKKLLNKIKIKIKKSDLQNYCKNFK